MAPTNPLPTILVIHGAWHTPAALHPLTSALSARSFKVHTPHLPSCTNTRPPPASFPEDVALIRTTLLSLIDAGETVVLVMHSYGGAVGSSAAANLDLSVSARAAAGKKGGVLHLVYLCAFMLELGTSLWDIVVAAGMTGLFTEAIEVGEDGSVFPRDPVTCFFNGPGIDAAQTKERLEGLVRFPMSAIEAKVTGEAWTEVPSTYVFTSEDYTVPGVYQDIMTGKVKEKGVEFGEVRVESGHSVFLARTEECVDVVVRVCGGGMEGGEATAVD